MTMDEVEAAERQEDLTAREQCRSELVEDNDEDYAEDTQTDDLEEDGEVYDDYDFVDYDVWYYIEVTIQPFLLHLFC